MRHERQIAGVRIAALGVACMSLVAGCNGTSSYLDATGTTGAEQATLGWWVTGASCAVVAIVGLAILAAIARHRGEVNDPRDSMTHGTTPPADMARRDIPGGLRWIYVGVGVTFVVLCITLAGILVVLNDTSHPPRTPSLVMDVTAHQWWWEVRYSQVGQPNLSFVTANEVHLPIGVPVRVRLRSADVIHSFWLPQIAGKTDVIPGQTNEMWVEAQQPGITRGMCAEYCGLEHAMMGMVVTAESPAAFNAWTQQRRAEAATPTDPQALAGAVVFTRSCGACHTVQGSDALGVAGPNLTHVASRTMIGAGALANTPNNLRRWIVNAPGIKAGVRMPATQLTAGELSAVVTYLQTLH